jgi:hypothetical protein
MFISLSLQTEFICTNDCNPVFRIGYYFVISDLNLLLGRPRFVFQPDQKNERSIRYLLSNIP